MTRIRHLTCKHCGDLVVVVIVSSIVLGHSFNKVLAYDWLKSKSSLL